MPEERRYPSQLKPLPKLQPLALRAQAKPRLATPSGRQPGDPAIDPYLIERAACDAIGIPHPRDVDQGTVQGLHHHIGTFHIAESEGATTAAVRAFRALHDQRFFTYSEYDNALRKIDSLRAKDGWDLTDIEKPFCARFQRDRYTANLHGYLTYVGDMVPALGEILSSSIAVYIPEEPRRTHTYLLGTTGSGKTELLKTLIHSYIAQPDSASVVVIEPSGEFVEQVAHWQEFVGSDRLVYLKLDIKPGLVPTINPLEIPNLDPNDTSREALNVKQVVAQQLLSALEEILGGRMGGDVSVNMRAVLMACLLVLLDKPGATLKDLHRFMNKDSNDDLVGFGATRLHYESAARLFQTSFNQTSFDVTRRSIFAKLQTLFDISFFGELTCGKSTVDLQYQLGRKAIILFDLSKGRLGNEASAAFGRLMIAYIQALAKRRGDLPKAYRVPIHLIIDECHNYLTTSVEEILAESRKLGLFLTLCQQNVGYQMGNDMRRIVANNTTVKIAGKVEPDQWERTSRQFPVDKEVMAALGKSKQKGVFIIRAGSGAEPFRFRARSDLIDFSNRMSPTMWEITKGRQARLFYRPVEEKDGRGASTEPQGTASPLKKKKFKLE